MSTRFQERLKTPLIGGLFFSLLCTYGVAGAQSEVEPNDSRAQAQVLVLNSSVTQPATMGTVPGGVSTDLDIYAFDAKAGDVPDIMVVSDGLWDPVVALYDATGGVLDMNDDAETQNPGSSSPLDPRIFRHRLLADGRYYVAISAVPRYLGDNFSIVFTDGAVGGAYSVTIAGVTPPPPPPPDPDPTPTPDPDPTPTPEPDPVPPPSGGGSDAKIVSIKIKHWTSADNEPENRNRKDLIPVAIISARDFNALTDVDTNSLTFGATGDEKSLMRCRKKGKNVRFDGRRDGLKDLVCYFKPEIADFQVNDVQGILKGKTVDGEPIEGTGALRYIRVSKRKDKSWHERHHRHPHGDWRRSRRD
jgi:hypothetical protein